MTSHAKAPQRIGYVLKRYPRFSETFIVNEILALEAAGVEIHIFALRPPADPHFQPAIARVRAPVTYLNGDGVRADGLWSALQQLDGGSNRAWRHLSAGGRASGTEVYQAARLALEIASRRIDHIHAHFATTATSVARLASLFAGVPYTFTAHAKDIFHEAVDPAELEQKIENAAAVVTVSEFNVAYLESWFPMCSAKLRCIYNGLDLEQFRFSSPRRRSPKIVAVGRLVEKKGFHDLIEACGLLHDAGIPFECEIIGGGDLEPVLSSRVHELGLGGLVQHSGPRPLSYVQGAIQQAAAMVVPSVTASTGDREGLPMVLLESMALGTPCVATTVTGIPEAIRDGETGLLVSERRPEQLAAAIRRLVCEDELRVELASGARALIEQRFEIHQNVAELRRLFSTCRKIEAPCRQFAEVG